MRSGSHDRHVGEDRDGARRRDPRPVTTDGVEVKARRPTKTERLDLARAEGAKFVERMVSTWEKSGALAAPIPPFKVDDGVPRCMVLLLGDRKLSRDDRNALAAEMAGAYYESAVERWRVAREKTEQ